MQLKILWDHKGQAWKSWELQVPGEFWSLGATSSVAFSLNMKLCKNSVELLVELPTETVGLSRNKYQFQYLPSRESFWHYNEIHQNNPTNSRRVQFLFCFSFIFTLWKVKLKWMEAYYGQSSPNMGWRNVDQFHVNPFKYPEEERRSRGEAVPLWGLYASDKDCNLLNADFQLCGVSQS